MSWPHLIAIVPVSLAGWVVLDWFAQRRKRALQAEADFVHECCCCGRR